MKVQVVKVRGGVKVGVVGALVSLCVGLLAAASGCEGRAYAQEAVLECGAPGLQAAPVAASFAGPRVLELKACEGVEGREPVGCGERFTAQEDRVWVWTSVANQGEPTTVEMVWKKDGQERQRMSLEVGRSPGWRTWGYHTMRRGDVGAWTVEVLDAQGALLGATSFEVEPKVASVPATLGL